MGAEVASRKPTLTPKSDQIWGLLATICGYHPVFEQLAHGMGRGNQANHVPKSHQQVGQYNQLSGCVPTHDGKWVNGLKFELYSVLYINMRLCILCCCRMSFNFCWLMGSATIFLKASLLNEFFG